MRIHSRLDVPCSLGKLQITAQIALDRIGYTCLRSIYCLVVLFMGKLDLNYGAKRQKIVCRICLCHFSHNGNKGNGYQELCNVILKKRLAFKDSSLILNILWVKPPTIHTLINIRILSSKPYLYKSIFVYNLPQMLHIHG